MRAHENSGRVRPKIPHIYQARRATALVVPFPAPAPGLQHAKNYKLGVTHLLILLMSRVEQMSQFPVLLLTHAQGYIPEQDEQGIDEHSGAQPVFSYAFTEHGRP